MDSRQFKEHIIKTTAEQLQQPQQTTASVISWMFADVTKAFKVYDKVELSGFGVFILSQAKLKKRITRLELILEKLKALPETETILRKTEGVEASLQYYYSKLIPDDKES